MTSKNKGRVQGESFRILGSDFRRFVGFRRDTTAPLPFVEDM
jgi:hypothetical protein